MTDTLIPSVEFHLPDLMPFIAQLAEEAQRGKLPNWETTAEQVRSFFTPAQMDHFDAAIPGWREMASYWENTTLIHVMLVFTSLLLCPEYQSASPEQQTLVKWSVLFHDLAKTVINGQRDLTHAFRSAALAGQILPTLGFVANVPANIPQWATLTRQATREDSQTHQIIQDNRQLPEIVADIDRLFDRPAALVIKTVLFHMSIDSVPDWPQAAPLTDQEISLYIDNELLPLLKIMTMVDSQAWHFFDPLLREKRRAEALTVFDRMLQTIRG